MAGRAIIMRECSRSRTGELSRLNLQNATLMPEPRIEPSEASPRPHIPILYWHQTPNPKPRDLHQAIEASIRSCLSDGKAEIRTNAKTMHALYEGLFPGGAEAFR
jgi:hypothetical protein